MTRKKRYCIGLDLGKRQDYTAVSVVRQAMKKTGELRQVGLNRWRPKLEFDKYVIEHLHRFEQGTPYRDVARYMRNLQQTEPLNQNRNRVVVDKTGVGDPVYEMLREEGVDNLQGVTITGGNSVNRDGRHYRVPKRDLASALQVLVQNNNLVYNEKLPFAEILAKEMQNFKVKIDLKTGHDSYEHREGENDDLVLAVALPCWYAEHGGAIDWRSLQPTHVSVN